VGPVGPAAPVAPPAFEPPAFEPPAFEPAPFEPAAGPAAPAPAPAPFAAAATPPGDDRLAAWEAQAAAGPERGSPTSGGAATGGDDPAPRRGKRFTAADGARTGSSFQLNKVVVGIAVVLAVAVLGWQAMSLLKTEEPKAAAPAGTTIPPLGEIAPPTTPETTPDGVIIVPVESTTTTVNSQPQCDSSTSVFSADGRGYRPCGGGFQVDLPGRADIRTSVAETDLGPVRWTSLTSTDNSKDPWVRSVVVYGDLPRELTPEEATAVQESLVAQLFAKPGATTTFQDIPALTFTGTDANGDDIVGVAFVTGTKAYAIATKSNGSPDAGFAALRDSFAFV
jgi:hypothetical protein